jgi:hypothetical protein
MALPQSLYSSEYSGRRYAQNRSKPDVSSPIRAAAEPEMQEVVIVNSLDSFGDFLIHRVVLQNRTLRRFRRAKRVLTPPPASPYTLAS